MLDLNEKYIIFKSSEKERRLMQAIIENLSIPLQANPTNPSGYTKESATNICYILMNILNDRDLSNKRLLILCEYVTF